MKKQSSVLTLMVIAQKQRQFSKEQMMHVKGGIRGERGTVKTLSAGKSGR